MRDFPLHGLALVIVGAMMIFLFARRDPAQAKRWRLGGAIFLFGGAIVFAAYAWPLISAAFGGSSA
jgi:hypothetical protein